MKKMVLVLILFLFPAAVFAGEYVLIKGKGVEVCEEYGKNLNSLNPPLFRTMYERKLNPEFKDFSKPEWEKLYYEHRESEKLFPKIDLFVWESDADPSHHNFVRKGKNLRNTQKQRTEAWKRYKADRQALLRPGLPISKVDIDNDGKIENIARDSVNNNILLVLNGDKTDIDLKKTALLLQHQSLPVDVEADIYDHVHYDVIIYKNKAYFDLWKDVREEKRDINSIWGILQVFITENQKTEELCTYNYR